MPNQSTQQFTFGLCLSLSLLAAACGDGSAVVEPTVQGNGTDEPVAIPASRPTAEEERSFYNNVLFEAETAKPNTTLISQSEWQKAVRDYWGSSGFKQRMQGTLEAVHGSQQAQEAMLKSLVKEADKAANWGMARDRAWQTLHLICIRRINEKLGPERTRQIIQEVRPSPRGADQPPD